VLEAIVQKIPAPKGDPEAPLRALIFDSWYDAYRGVIILARIVDGRIYQGMRMKLHSTGKQFDVEALGFRTPNHVPCQELVAGEVGWIIGNIKEVGDAKVGDTILDAANPPEKALPGFKESKPMVFAGLYPVEAHQHTELRDALEKLRLNDSSLQFEPESSEALGFGFRCGFLGLLHMEIIQARLEREFNLDLITTAPGVRYLAHTTDGVTHQIESPSKLPDPGRLDYLEEPYISSTIITRSEYVGGILALAEERRGTQKSLQYLTTDRVLIEYDFPLAEVIHDFYDRLKSASRGYASFDYQMTGYRRSELVKLDILINGDPVDALSLIVHRDNAYQRGKVLVEKMKELIPRQMFEVVLQAAIGSRIIARESIRPISKNVIAKCYGGDISRKRKLIEKQKEGKKRMKRVGRVDIPQEAFLAVLRVD
jgi:GTP-binding protein LepA